MKNIFKAFIFSLFLTMSASMQLQASNHDTNLTELQNLRESIRAYEEEGDLRIQAIADASTQQPNIRQERSSRLAMRMILPVREEYDRMQRAQEKETRIANQPATTLEKMRSKTK
ncbi:MAG: hypothetical protein JO129_01865 [Candidatus Dependentiae bacterium]|nr:hypothetical protein [Candidatus Dependentiae bacterium]